MHRDIKPDNFVLGNSENRYTIYIIDLGLAKRFYDPLTQKHIPFIVNKKLAGTARYASVYTHKGYEQSRRDDLECLGYSLIYFMKGSLPWQGIKAHNLQLKYEKIYRLKNLMGIESLCQGLPIGLQYFMKSIRSIGFDEKPDYNALRKIFVELLNKNNLNMDFSLDWDKLNMNFNDLHDKNQKNEESQQARVELSEKLKLMKVAKANSSSSSQIFIKINLHTEQNTDRLKNLREVRKLEEGKSSKMKNNDESCNLNIQDTIEDLSMLSIYVNLYQ